MIDAVTNENASILILNVDLPEQPIIWAGVMQTVSLLREWLLFASKAITSGTKHNLTAVTFQVKIINC